VAAVAELDLPAFDYTDPALSGEPFHEAMREAREREREKVAAAPA
jgi:hypothetical protein